MSKARKTELDYGGRFGIYISDLVDEELLSFINKQSELTAAVMTGLIKLYQDNGNVNLANYLPRTYSVQSNPPSLLHGNNGNGPVLAPLVKQDDAHRLELEKAHRLELEKQRLELEKAHRLELEKQRLELEKQQTKQDEVQQTVQDEIQQPESDEVQQPEVKKAGGFDASSMMNFAKGMNKTNKKED